MFYQNGQQENRNSRKQYEELNFENLSFESAIELGLLQTSLETTV